MPVNNFSVGRDISVTVVTASGPLFFNLITDFTSKQDTTKTRIKGLDGKTRWVRFFDGWSGSFKIERRDSTPDDYFSQLEANYYQGLNEQAASITEIIQEPNGSLTQYRYFGALLDFDDAGNWSGDATVKQTISFVCERRIKVQ
jgi:hypothetical protein